MKINIADYPKGPGDRKVSVEVSTDDTYSLDHTLALVIHPALLKFKKIAFKKIVFAPTMQYDDDFPDDDKKNKKEEERAKKEGKQILDKMILAFKMIIDDETYTEEQEEIIKEGLELFGKYYQHLWW